LQLLALRKTFGLLEHTVIAQQLLDKREGVAEEVKNLKWRVEQLEAAAASTRKAARPAWASRMKRADADLMLAAHDGDIDAAEAALAAGADVNCKNQVRQSVRHARVARVSLRSHSSRSSTRRPFTW
jgi:hypothetical protein